LINSHGQYQGKDHRKLKSWVYWVYNLRRFRQFWNLQFHHLSW